MASGSLHHSEQVNATKQACHSICMATTAGAGLELMLNKLPLAELAWHSRGIACWLCWALSTQIQHTSSMCEFIRSDGDREAQMA